jgi:hypothetical protein
MYALHKTYFYKILAEIQGFTVKVAFLEEAKNGVKWSINLHYGNKMAIFRFQKCYLELKRQYLD